MSKLDLILNTTIGEYLKEALSDKDKEKVNNWKKGDNSFTDKLFGGPDTDKETHQRRYFDFEQHETSPVQKDIEAHLSKHGYKVTDYKQNKATDAIGRETRIGRALERTKANPELLKKYNEDPVRASKTQSNLRILLSRHPHDVAGMTSPGQSWCGPGGSCMNFHVGSNRKYLPKDVRHGTHVAYLVHADDEGHPQRPIARIAIKKFSDGKRHMLGVEKVYGQAPKGFKEQVEAILDREHNSRFPVGVYTKHEKVYDDVNEPEKFHMGSNIEKALTHKSPQIRTLAFKNGQGITPEHITRGLQDKDSNVRLWAARRPEAGDDHIMTAIGDSDPFVASGVLLRDDIKPDHIEKGLQHSDPFVRGRSAAHKNALFHQFEAGAGSADHITRMHAFRSHHAQDHHIDLGIRDPSLDVAISAADNRNAKAHHLDYSYNRGLQHQKDKSDPLSGIRLRSVSARHPNASEELKSKALDDQEQVVRAAAAENPTLASHHIDKAISDSSIHVVGAGFRNPNIQPHHVDKAFEQFKTAPKVSQLLAIDNVTRALSHPTSVMAHHVDKAIDTNNDKIILHALKHSASDETHITKLLHNTWDKVQTRDFGELASAVFEHPKFTPEHLESFFDKVKNEPGFSHKAGTGAKIDAAMAHRKTKSHHIDAAIESNFHSSIEAALKRKDLQPHHIEKILSKFRSNAISDSAFAHPAFKKTSPTALLASSDINVQTKTLDTHPGIEAHHISGGLASPISYVRRSAIRRPEAQDQHIDFALKDNDAEVVKAALQHQNTKDHHIDFGLSHPDPSIRAVAAEHAKTPEQIDRAFNDNSMQVLVGTLKNKNLQDRHIRKVMDGKHDDLKFHAFNSNHPSITPADIHQAITSGALFSYTPSAALRHQNANSDNFNAALDSDKPILYGAVAQDPRSSAEHLGKILSNPAKYDKIFRAAALRNPNSSRSLLVKGLRDPDISVRKVAIERLRKPKVVKENTQTEDLMSELIEARYRTINENAWINSEKELDTISKCIDLFSPLPLKRSF